ncbi:hypothetical protein K1719_003057 [Acacia pycnantha]|nr:hypothetical protein K1719_003057 [Acacia pycnantha]
MMSRTALVLLLVSLYLLPFQCTAEQQLEVRAAYWRTGGISISEIDPTLFTHLIFAQAYVDPKSFEISILPSDERDFKAFSHNVKENNPSIKTLLTIWGNDRDTNAAMVKNSSSISSFIQSSQRQARTYGFDGVDLYWDYLDTNNDMEGMSTLLQQWRSYMHAHDPELLLTATVPYSPYWPSNDSIYPVDSMATSLDWVHLKTFSYVIDRTTVVTAAHSALYDPSSIYSTDFGIKHWIHGGLKPSKMVLGLAFFGYAWNLRDPNNNAIGAPATGTAQTKYVIGLGLTTYKEIKDEIQSCPGNIKYNHTYEIYTWSCGSTWIGYDDVDTIKTKVSYAKENKLRGYVAYEVSYDDNWLLSRAAKGEDNKAEQRDRRARLLKIILAAAVVSILLLGFLVYIRKRRMFKLKGIEDAEDLNANAPDVKVFSFSDIERATNQFSIENQIGEGGFGIVYKGILPDGEEIAVKRRSKGSKQGFKEFKNETTLNAKLQHVNLVRLVGYCNDREEQMLVYEYMPNKSLDFYLYDPTKKHLLDWEQRVCIIEGVTQGLIYLQEYSRLTIIHRDLKASNILLDHEMKPKISDFGMARPFNKHEREESASKLVGTYGYIPPEYVEKGLCSIKSDVYSFGIILLQIISGKRISSLYGESYDLNLLEYAYVLWKEGKGMEFMDSALDDTSSQCKLIRFLEIALLCVQKNAEDRPCMLEAFFPMCP